MSNYIYDYQETVRVDGIDGLYVVSSRKTKSLPSGVVTRYYSLIGAVTGKPPYQHRRDLVAFFEP